MSQIEHLTDEKGVPDAMQMVRNLMEGHESVVRTGRAVVETAEAAGDVASADLVTQRIVHEKTAWMLRSTAS